MTGGARQARVTRAVDFPLAGLVITVGEIEGTVQMIITRDGWFPGEKTRRVLCNEFAGPDTPGQLDALAAHLRTIFDQEA